MVIPTGKITEQDKLVGLVAFDTDRGIKRILTINEAYGIAKENNSVCGLITYKKANGTVQVIRSKQYIWNKIPECNGKGIPENNEVVYMLVGRYIDKKHKTRFYIICDSYGNTELNDKDGIIDMLTDNEIIGLVKKKNGNINSYIQSFLNEEQMEKLGFSLRNGNV